MKTSLAAFALLLTPLSAGAAAPVSRTPAVKPLPVTERPITAEYEVYIGGVHLLNAMAYVNLDTRQYHMLARAETTGIWGSWFPWEMTVESIGHTRATTVEPARYRTMSAWKHKPQTIFLNYEKDGKVIIAPESTDAPEPKDRLADAVTSQTVDPLSGVLQLMAHYTTHDDCNAAAYVFDGKRRFDLETEDKGIVTLRTTELSVFAGEARKCELRFNLLAGDRDDRQKRMFWTNAKNRNNRPPFTVWLGRLRPDMPPLPVMAETSSPFGYVMVYLKAWRLDDKPRAAQLTMAAAKDKSEPETKLR